MSKHDIPPPKRRHGRQKQLRAYSVGLLCTMFMMVSAFAWGRWFWPTDEAASPPSASIETSADAPASSKPRLKKRDEPIVASVRFSAAGDNLIHAPIYKQAARRASGEEGYSFDYCYEDLVQLWSEQDVNWVNQETLCTRELEPSTYPCFSTPAECAEALYRGGVRVFSLANNHTYDKGAAGIAATLRFWDSMPEDVVTTGLWQGESDYDNIPIHTVNGVTIAYLSYTEHTNGIKQSSAMTANVIYISQTDIIERQVRRAAELADFVVVGAHWGTEDSHTINSGQRALAQKLADWGADVIIGTHPHVLQDAAWLTAADGRQVFTAYSLGNMISSQSKPDQLIGAILTLELRKTTQPDGTVSLAVLEPKLTPTVTHYDAGKSNVRTYLLRDYTQDLASAHGARANYPSFGLDYIRETVAKYISPEFLNAA